MKIKRSIFLLVNKITLINVFTIILFGFLAGLFCVNNTYFPSSDSPAHFHNSNLLNEFFKSNSLIQQNFSLTSFFTPNLFSNYFLMFLLNIMTIKHAIFIFHFLYFFTLIFSFYYFLYALKIPQKIFLSLIAVLFYNTFLFSIGFLNFSYSIIFLIFSIAYYHHKIIYVRKIRISHACVFFVFLLFLYYSNALSFILFITYLIVFEIIKLCVLISKKHNNFKTVFFKNLLVYFFTITPFLIMLFCFKSKVAGQINLQKNDLNLYLKNITDFTSFVIYVRETEVELTKWLFLSVSALFGYSIISRFFKSSSKIHSTDVFLFISLISLCLYFFVPDNYSVGMMSTRLQYYFYLFLILWLIVQKAKWPKLIVVLICCILSIYKYYKYQSPIISILNNNAVEIENASMYISKNSVVHSVNLSDNWWEAHYSNYLGLDRPMVILENYEASVGWFPLKWDTENKPIYTFGGQKIVNEININLKEKEVDYVFVYGNLQKLNNDTTLLNRLNRSYYTLYNPKNSFLKLYKRR